MIFPIDILIGETIIANESNKDFVYLIQATKLLYLPQYCCDTKTASWADDTDNVTTSTTNRQDIYRKKKSTANIL